MSIFVTRETLQSGAKLAEAFETAYNRAIATETRAPMDALFNEVGRLGVAVKQFDFDTGVRIQHLSETFGLVDDSFRKGELLLPLLEALDPSLLASVAKHRLSLFMSPEEARRAVTRNLKGAASEETNPDDLVLKIVGPAKRRKVTVAGDVISKAQANMQEAINTSLSAQVGGLPPALRGTLIPYLDAIISGELGASTERRDEAAVFIAKSPKHAAAYARRALTNAVEVGAFKPGVIFPLVVPSPDLIKVTEEPQQPVSAKDEAERAPVTISGLREALEGLIRTHPDVTQSLTAANPDTFAPSELRRLLLATQVLQRAAAFKSPRERAQFLLDSADNGEMPKGFLTFRNTDSATAPIVFPDSTEALKKAVPERWSHPLWNYTNSPEYVAELADRSSNPESMSVRLADAERVFDHKRDLGLPMQQRLSDIRTLLHNGNVAEARKLLLTVGLDHLGDSIALLQANEIIGMQEFKERILQEIRENRLTEVEVLFDFSNMWITVAVGWLRRIDDFWVRMRLFVPEKEANNFRQTAQALLRNGALEDLHTLFANINPQLRGREMTLKVFLGIARDRIKASLTEIVEVFRVAGAIPEGAERTRLARQLPPMGVLLSPNGPRNIVAARKHLRERGLPLPGQPNVPALGTSGTRGYLPSGAGPSDRPALPENRP